jgi:hypothetical protein
MKPLWYRDDPRTRLVEGGGARGYEGVSLYLLLAVKQLRVDLEVRGIADEFKKIATFANRKIGGEVVDLV